MDDTDNPQISRPHGRPGFTIKMVGPRVGKGRLSAKHLATIFLHTQQALRRIGQALYAGSATVGKRKEIDELCEIFLVGWKAGSAIAEFELAEPPLQMDFLVGHVGEESLKAFLNGLELMRGSSRELRTIPRGFDAAVLHECDLLGRVLDHGIESITFEPIRVAETSSVSFDRRLRDTVRTLLTAPVDLQQAEKVGRLEVLDGHQGFRGRLWESDGTKWLCVFKPEHADVLRDAWLHPVRVTGQLMIRPSKEPSLLVSSVIRLAEEVQPGPSSAERGKSEFWTSLSLQELAENQGVTSVTDLDDISKLWPVDDDPDELLSHILKERAVRRRIASGGHE